MLTQCTRGLSPRNLTLVQSLVLIAEEDHAVAAQLRSAIRQHRPVWPMTAVANGDHAIAYLRGMARAVKSPITPLLLLSLTIPQVSALQILDWVKRQSALRTLITGLLCGVAEIPDFERLTKYGVHAVLNKPVLIWQVAELMAAIENGDAITPPTTLTEAPSPLVLPSPAILGAAPELQLAS